MTHSDNRSRTLNSLIDASAKNFQQRPAVSMAFEPAATYEEFLEKINLVAAILSEEGLKKGDRASILAENSPAWGIAYLAIVRLGAIVVPILPDFHETDVHHILTDAEVKVLFTTKTQIEKTYELPKRTLKTIITLDDFA
ncbi:MAG: AMP-binding protein, partial [Desulfobulbaceae bacterium]|nr:AMP-binding protein [Desulfobulbaceae bacterium]